MGTALTLVILFAISSTIIRIASVFLEHTGLPRSIARFQALSALSGTGYTTSESEDLLRYPARRKILSYLIVVGNVGLASIAATLIVGVIKLDTSIDGLFIQFVALLGAIAVIRFILTSAWLDTTVCAMASRWLARNGEDRLDMRIIHRLGADYVIAEHGPFPDRPVSRDAIAAEGLTLLGVRREGSNNLRTVEPHEPILPSVAVVLFGPDDAHQRFSALSR